MLLTNKFISLMKFLSTSKSFSKILYLIVLQFVWSFFVFVFVFLSFLNCFFSSFRRVERELIFPQIKNKNKKRKVCEYANDKLFIQIQIDITKWAIKWLNQLAFVSDSYNEIKILFNTRLEWQADKEVDSIEIYVLGTTRKLKPTMYL